MIACTRDLITSGVDVDTGDTQLGEVAGTHRTPNACGHSATTVSMVVRFRSPVTIRVRPIKECRLQGRHGGHGASGGKALGLEFTGTGTK